MTDALVVGGGLFGQIIAAELRRLGQSVHVIDRREPLAGSRPAACLMKPSWFAGLGRDVHVPALETLDRLYGVQDLTFDIHVGKLGKMTQGTVHWVDPARVLDGPALHASAIGVAARRVTLANGETLEARNVIVAAGVWTETLLRQYAQGWQRGMATLYAGAMGQVARGVIKPWAPYRQLVGFDRGDGLWVGDGSAIKHANWSALREEEIAAREDKLARRMADPLLLHRPQRLQGLRPYWKAKPCLLERVEDGLWVASGGAKNGTLAAGWAAWRLGRELG